MKSAAPKDNQHQVSNAIEGLMVCFGFTSINEIRQAAMARIGRSDDDSLELLLNELSNDAIAKSGPAFEEYRNSRDGAIDSAIARSMLSAGLVGRDKKKIARTSSLAMRFYIIDGWTIEELNCYLDQGSFHCAHPDDIEPYYTLAVGSRYHVEKIDNAISEIICAFSDQKEMSRIALLEHMNWRLTLLRREPLAHQHISKS